MQVTGYPSLLFATVSHLDKYLKSKLALALSKTLAVCHLMFLFI